MQSPQIDYPQNVTLYLDESSIFNRYLLSLIKQWDKRKSIEVHSVTSSKPIDLPSESAQSDKKQKQFCDAALRVVDQNGSSFQGAEAVPIILKHLPFGKLAAALYILPGTMWVTKQLCSLRFTH